MTRLNTHLDEGAIMLLRDEGAAGPGVREHLAGCLECRARLAEAEERGVRVRSALGVLAEEVDLPRARDRVRLRIGLPGERVDLRGRDLRRAAAVLLLAATGAAAALPGSPLRRWIMPAAEVAESGSAAPLATGGPSAEDARAAAPAESRVSIEVPDEGIVIVLEGETAGSELRVLWTQEGTAHISAPEGSTFRYERGRLETRLRVGTVSVEVPGGPAPVRIEVDGVPVVSRSGGRVEVHGTTAERPDEPLALPLGRR